MSSSDAPLPSPLLSMISPEGNSTSVTKLMMFSTSKELRLFSASPVVVITSTACAVDVSAVDVSGVDVSDVDVSRLDDVVLGVGCVDACVVKINFGSRMVLGLESLLLALTMIPPSTLTVTVFSGGLGIFVVVVVVIVVVVVTFVVVVVFGVGKVLILVVVVAVDDLVVVVVIMAGVVETFLFLGLTGGVMRIEGRCLGFSELLSL